MAYSLIAHAQTASTDGTGVTTGAINTSGADLIVVSVNWYYFGDNTPSVSDSKSNSYTSLTTKQDSNDAACQIWYVQGGTVGSGHTVTVSGSGFYPVLSVTAWSGSTASPFDQESGASAGPLSSSIAPGTLFPAEDNELIISSSCYSSFGQPDASALSVNGGFTQADTALLYSPGAHQGGGQAYLIQTSKAFTNPTWSIDSTANAFSAVQALFKAGAAPTGHPVMRRWGGVSYLGGQGIGQKGGGGGRAWGRAA